MSSDFIPTGAIAPSHRRIKRAATQRAHALSRVAYDKFVKQILEQVASGALIPDAISAWTPDTCEAE